MYLYVTNRYEDGGKTSKIILIRVGKKIIILTNQCFVFSKKTKYRSLIIRRQKAE